MPHPELFTPLRLGAIELPNRIVVSPMCQYMANDGCMTDWHLVHLGQLALSRAGLVVVEATHVTREGRITHGCAGLYDEANEAAMARVVQAARRLSRHPLGIQVGHAGRKGSAQRPWEGRGALGPAESPWQTVAPSAIAYGEGWHVPRALERGEVQALPGQFAAAAERARRIGFDLFELHSAHGYLMHQFLSPLSNRREDEYGRDRMKAPLEIAAAVREAWPRERALGARISASDWAEGGLGPQDGVDYARALKRLGYDYVCVSSGGLVAQQKLQVGPGYQVAFAERVRRETGMPVRAVGMIADPLQAEAIVAGRQADMVAIGRGFLDNPRWVWHAADRMGVKLDYPPQYDRSRPEVWPGARLARPA